MECCANGTRFFLNLNKCSRLSPVFAIDFTSNYHTHRCTVLKYRKTRYTELFYVSHTSLSFLARKVSPRIATGSLTFGFFCLSYFSSFAFCVRAKRAPVIVSRTVWRTQISSLIFPFYASQTTQRSIRDKSAVQYTIKTIGDSRNTRYAKIIFTVNRIITLTLMTIYNTYIKRRNLQPNLLSCCGLVIYLARMVAHTRGRDFRRV